MSYHGYGIAALAFSAMISAPIYARIGDKLMSCKLVLRVGIVFSIVGNFVYFAFPNANMIIVARMISGLGWGLEGAFYSYTAGPGNLSSKKRLRDRLSGSKSRQVT
jgi:predicted MFS family arabinose efflux permease